MKGRRGRLTPYQSEDPSPTLPTYRGKEEKGKIVEDKNGESNLANKKVLDLLLKPVNPTPSNTGSAVMQQNMFRRLVRHDIFPACWRQANVTTIPKSPPSSVANYRPISKTSVLSKVFERLVSVRLGRFMERSGVLPTSQFAHRKGLGTCDALLCLSHSLQSALESDQEARIV